MLSVGVDLSAQIAGSRYRGALDKIATMVTLRRLDAWERANINPGVKGLAQSLAGVSSKEANEYMN